MIEEALSSELQLIQTVGCVVHIINKGFMGRIRDLESAVQAVRRESILVQLGGRTGRLR